MNVRTRTARSRRTSALLVLGSVVAASMVLTGCNDADHDKHPEHRAFALHGKKLTITSDDSGLELVPADIHNVRVTRWFEGSVTLGHDPKVTWSMKNDHLSLKMRCSGIITDCSARHRVEVPRDVAVEVENSDGSVRAGGFRTALTVHTADGSVRIKDSSGPLNLTSQDGSIRAEGIRTDSVRAHTQDGSVKLSFARIPGAVDAKSQDGSITIALPVEGSGSSRTTYQVETHSDDGHVEVSVPRDGHSTHRVSARTSDGHITVGSMN